jgi:NAD(P)H dehydrogenase (quinone)
MSKPTEPTKILIILGHPRRDSFCGALAQAYGESAKRAGAMVQELALGDLQFDPILRVTSGQSQPLEPDLVRAQQLIQWAQHLVLVYPNWWGSMPALMKGFFDRTLLQNFAFRYRPNSAFWERLLTLRTAHLIVTMDTPPWYYRWIYGQPGHRQMQQLILGFCGIKPVKITSFGSVRRASQTQRQQWLIQVQRLANAAMPN